MSHEMYSNFINNAVAVTMKRGDALGLAAAGSWITNEIDEYSDLDLIFVSKGRLSDDKDMMLHYAGSLGELLSAFTGEHVGENRLLICLYDNPLLHIDIKFLVPEEFYERIEDPVVLWEREQCLTNIIRATRSEWPGIDYQWIEDRFWTWIHYATLKLGRGENFEALEFLSFLRQNVLAPLIQVKNGKLPRGLRKIEINCPESDVNKLVDTVPAYRSDEIFNSLYGIILLYKELREAVFPASVILKHDVERRVVDYYKEIKNRKTG